MLSASGGPTSGGPGGPASFSAPATSNEPTLFIRMRGLPWGSKKTEINAFFEDTELADSDINILKMPDGKASGEALIGLRTQEHYDACMKYEKKYLGTRYIELYESSLSEWDRVHNRSSRERTIPIQAGSFVILMRGLPYSASETDCINFFQDIRVLGVHLPKDSMGRPSGQGYAEFSTKEDFERALLLNKQHLQNRYIELFESSHQDLGRAMNPGAVIQPRKAKHSAKPPAYHPHPGHGPPGPYGGRPGGVPGGYNPNSSAPRPEPHCLKMRGLPYNTSETGITNFFADAKVTPMRIHRKADGAEAFVEFASREEQELGLGLHKAFLGRRYVELFAIPYGEVCEKVGIPLPPQRPSWQQPPPAQHGQQHHYGGGAQPTWGRFNYGQQQHGQQHGQRYQPYSPGGAPAKTW